MSPAEIKAAREALGMTLASFAFWLGLEGEHGRRKIRAWESGKEQITGPAARAIKLAVLLNRASALFAHGAGAMCESAGRANQDRNIEEAAALLSDIESALGRSREPARAHSIRGPIS